MATNLGTAYVAIVPSLQGVQGQLMRQMVPQVGAVGDQAGRSMGSRMVSSIGTAMKRGAVVAGAGIVGIIGTSLAKGFARLSAIENAEAKLAGLGNSAKDVTTIMENALSSVKGTAFGMDEAATTAAAAVAAGIKPGKELTRYLGLVGDAATIGGASMSEMGAIFNKVATSGKVQGEVFAQLGDRGIPVVTMLAKELGVTAGEVYKLGSEGKINSEQFLNAMSSMEGAALKSGNTTTGAMKNFWAAISRFGAQLLQDVYPLIGPLFNTMTQTVDGLAAKIEPLAILVGSRLKSGFETLSSAAGPALRSLRDILVNDVIPAVQATVGFVQRNQEVIKFLAVVVGSAVIAWKAYTAAQAAYTAVTVGVPKVMAAARTAVLAFNAALRANPIGIIITLLVALVAGIVYAYKNFEGFRNVVDTVFRAVGSIVTWLYERIWKPVWTGIRTYLAVSWAIMKTLFDGIVWLIRNTLGPIFTWLYRNMIRPAFDWATQRIDSFKRWFDITVAAARVIIDRLGRTFRALYDNFIRPAFDNIRNKIQTIWNIIRDNIFKPMASWISDRIAPGFQKGVDAISRAWQKVKSVASGPVKFVIDTVINKGFIKNFNVVARKFGIGTLPEISTKGFYAGGIIPGRDPGKRDNMLVPMRSGEGVLTPEAVRMMGGPAWVHRTNAAAAGRSNPAHMAVGSPVYGGQGSFSNPLQHAIHRTGRLNVTGSAFGWNLDSAIAMLDRATSIRVRKGGGGSNSVNVVARPYADWWAGYYAGNSIYLNNNVMGPGPGRRTVAAHELGHALGLPHSMPNGAWSIMNYNNMYKHHSVTKADVAALRAIYGGHGIASGSSPEDEKGGLIKRIIDGLMKRFNFDSLLGGIPGGGFMLELMKKAANKAFDGLKSWIPKALDKINPLKDIVGGIRSLFGGDAAPGVQVFDGGGWLKKSAAPQLMWHRQEKPDAVLSNSDWNAVYQAARRPGGGAGLHIENLNALDTTEAMRTVSYERQKWETLHNV